MKRSPHPVDDGAPRLLRAGTTCWRVEQAGRAAFVVDAAAYFAAAKAAMRKARHSILILGWDFDPRTRLDPANEAADRPDRLGPFLNALVAEREDLRVHILIWDMALPIALPRRMIPRRAPNWFASDRIVYRLDDAHPTGACQHQKILVVDDAVAFCGGIDFAGNRWDTPAHRDHEPYRRLPWGGRYEPVHDVMMAVDGPAAAALGELVRERWRRAAGARPDPPPASGDAWPEELEPDLTGVPIGIARTEPARRDGHPGAHEVEALHLAAIARARSRIYLESQYVAEPVIGAALAKRLADPDGPEVVVVCPERSPSYFDRLVMDPARNRLVAELCAADRHGRFRAYAPVAAGGTPIAVHSKLALIDDCFLRIGSANLNNRSMGFDTECDLAIEAAPDRPGGDRVGRRIRRFQVRLLAEHLGAPEEAVAAALERTGSLVAGIEALNRDAGRRLRPIATPEPGAFGRLIARHHLLDPHGTADAWRPWKRRSGFR